MSTHELETIGFWLLVIILVPMFVGGWLALKDTQSKSNEELYDEYISR